MASQRRDDPEKGPAGRSVLGERMGRMTIKEMNEFLQGAWIAHLACLTPSGAPYVVPAWYWWDGVAFWLLPRMKSKWAHYVAKDPRVSLVVDEPDPPIRKVVVQGTAVVVEAGVGPYLANGEPSIWNQIGGSHMGPRYLGEESAKYRDSVNVEPCWSIKVVPTEIKTWQGVGWASRYKNEHLHAEAGQDRVMPTYYG
jgi:hypothetical protein